MLISAPAPKKTDVAVDESKAKSFLGSLKRQRRQLWDRTRPEVQRWYQQFLYMGFDEAVRTCPRGAWLPAGRAWGSRGTAWGDRARKSRPHYPLQKYEPH